MTSIWKESKTNNDESLFTGLLFALNDEIGPTLKMNLSSLTEREAIATAIQGITAVGLSDEKYRGLFGPIPVPYNNNYRALIFVFYVESNTSNDPIILQNGRFCSIFLIFKKELIKYVAQTYSMIESLLNIYQENYLLKEENLQENLIQFIYNELIINLKLKPKIRLFRVNNGITVEFEESKVIFGNELTLLINEKDKAIYIHFPTNLTNDKKDSILKIPKQINKQEYQDTFQIKQINSKKKFVGLLKKNNVTIIS